MKKLLLTLVIACRLALFADAAEPATIVAPTTTQNNFVLYPTVNIYTFLKLDTRNGRIWQVQYAVKELENEFEVALNSIELVSDGKAGRFALYPTTNNWTFLLLDTVNGYVYHVQWSQDASLRGVLPITSPF